MQVLIIGSTNHFGEDTFLPYICNDLLQENLDLIEKGVEIRIVYR
jgi:hypothetical protein